MQKNTSSTKVETSAKRTKALRLRALKSGKKRLDLTIDGKALSLIDELVEFYGLSSRAEAIEGLLKKPLLDTVMNMREFKKEEQLEVGNTQLTNEHITFIQEIKILMWNILINGTSTEIDEQIQKTLEKLKKEASKS